MAAAPRLSLGKKVLFSIAVTVAFFALLEGVLALAGVKPRLFADDPYVGFSSTTPLFVPVTSDDGTQWMTTSPAKLTLFNEQRFRADKPDGVTRIFCVGGSTTFGRPYDDATSFCGWIRAFLDEADPGSFEVVNAGGVSYASYRVALLMEELADYEPDLFVVYSGHNEFLEERTYRDLMEMPEALRGLGGLAARTRIHTAVTGLLNPSAPTETDQGTTTVLAAEVTTRLDDSIGPDAYERDPELQEAILAHYRYNLARMVDIARAAGARGGPGRSGLEPRGLCPVQGAAWGGGRRRDASGMVGRGASNPRGPERRGHRCRAGCLRRGRRSGSRPGGRALPPRQGAAGRWTSRRSPFCLRAGPRRGRLSVAVPWGHGSHRPSGRRGSRRTPGGCGAAGGRRIRGRHPRPLPVPGSRASHHPGATDWSQRPSSIAWSNAAS
jgi:hypothetical protein